MLRSIRFFLCFLTITVFALPIYAQSDDDSTPPPPADPVEILITWNEDVLVIQNTADSPVDLNSLRLEGLLGEINRTDWEMRTNPDRGVLFDLRTIPSGSCLLAYDGATAPDLPEDVICEVVAGEFRISTTDDIIWQIDSGEFTPYIDQIELDPCDTTETSCAILVSPSSAGSNDSTLDEPEFVDVRAIWTPDVFVLINISGRGADLSELVLQATRGEITPDDWVLDFSQTTGEPYTLDNVRPGSCLVSYIGAARPQLPTTISCSRIIGRSVLADFTNAVWEVTPGGFTPVLAGEELEHCSNQRTSCNIEVPNADLTTDQSNQGGEMTVATVEIRATWTPDLLVIVNESESNVDLSDLHLTSRLGRIDPSNWELSTSATGQAYSLANMGPGACLIAYFGFSRPDFPSDFTCNPIIGEYAIPTPNNIIWGVAQGGFTPMIGDVAGDTCDIQESSCDFPVPEAG